MVNGLMAKIFVSCGQTEGSIEEEIAKAIKDILGGKGFDPYVAGVRITPTSIRENIFNEIQTSEYFLFIDFAREEIMDKKPNRETGETKVHRGSLFCHQELAIASFLEIPLIAFQQKGVEERNGLSKYIQWKPVPFEDPKELPELILKKIEEEKWITNWKNQLVINRNNDEFDDAVDLRFEKMARYYHLGVYNQNIRKQAINCYGFLEKIVNLNTGEKVIPRTIELKWAGYMLPNATILPNSQRLLDAFFVLHENPNGILSNVFSDSSYYRWGLDKPGEYGLTFRVISDNFQPSISTFYLRFGNSLDEIEFKKIDS